jgi:hypothetical protein
MDNETKQPTVSNPLEHVVSCDLAIEVIANFVNSYVCDGRLRYNNQLKQQSITVFMSNYIEEMKVKSKSN